MAKRSLNQCNFIGNVGKDPEVRYTDNGTAVCNFTIGVNHDDRVTWVRCVAWQKLAEICGQYLTKGREVFISGRLENRTFQKDGADHTSTEIILNDMQMLGSKEAS